MGDEGNLHIAGGEKESSIHTALLGPPSSAYYEGCSGCLLDRRKAASQGTIQYKELSFVALLALCNSLPICSLFSYVYFMVRDLGVAKSVTQIGRYSGFLGSALLLGRFLMSTPWGMVADRFGHKPVILLGTTTIVVFNTLFGFSSNYWIALMSRFLLGIGNGMTGTLTAYASEISSREHQPLAMSVIGTMWGVGLIVGPAIGGYLAQPSEKLPAIFPSGSLFDRFPYALPSVCISAFALAGFVSSFFLPVCFFTGAYILINNSVETSQRGVANGVFASFMSASQAIAPTLGGAVFSWSEERMDASFLPGMWMVFSLLGVLSFLPFLATFEPFLPPSLNNPFVEA